MMSGENLVNVCSEDITELFTKLAKSSLSNSQHNPTLVQPLHTYDKKCRKLRNATYNSLFKFLKGPHVNTVENLKSNCKLSEIDQLVCASYQLRQNRRFDEANKFDYLIDKLITSGVDSELKNILWFLLALAKPRNAQKGQFVGHGDARLPIVFRDKSLPQILPNGPLLYGDTNIQRYDNCFMHYPKGLFEISVNLTDDYDEDGNSTGYFMPSNSLFEAKPGTALIGNGTFNFRGALDDDYEKDSKDTLFGALVQSHVDTIDFKLSLPQLSEEWDNSMFQIRVPKATGKFNEISEDEGFVDRGSSMSSSCAWSPEPSPVEDIWELGLKYQGKKHYVWEHVGGTLEATERPFLTEAGPEVFDKLCIEKDRQILLLKSTLKLPVPQRIMTKRMVKDIVFALIGVPSNNFVWCENSEEFIIKEGIHLPGTTHESTTAVCKDLLICGANYYRLNQFAHPPEVNSMYKDGLIFQAFTSAVRKYLQHYRGCILSLPTDKTLMELNFILNKVMNQLRFMAEVCMCSVGGRPPPPEYSDGGFPTGLRLLSYLYQEALDSAGSYNYAMILSLLNTSCAPYIMFVQDWVFHGVCRDHYGEFMVQVNDDYLRFRDKHFWTHGYVLTSNDATESVPSFLSHLANDIFVCGKTINLLRLCAPEHFLFRRDHETPRVIITFSEQELQFIERRCQVYLSRMQEIARQQTLSRLQLQERAKQAKRDLIIKARQVAAGEMDRLQARILEMRKAKEAKKKRLYDELKEQMEKDLERRSSVKKAEKEEDKARMVTANKQEVFEAHVEEDIENRAREELIQYYDKLTDDATYREAKALWRVRRLKLESARREFLEKQNAIISEELSKANVINEEENEETDGQDNFDSDGLPQWAKRADDSGKPIEVDGESVVDLPNWAKRAENDGEENTLTVNAEISEKESGPNVQNEADDPLPNWTKKGLERGSSQPILVGGESGEKSMSDTDLPTWAKKGEGTGPNWLKKGLERSSSQPILVEGGDEIDSSGADVVKSTKPHPSDSTVGNVMKHCDTENWKQRRKSDTDIQALQEKRPSDSVTAVLHPSASSIENVLKDKTDLTAEPLSDHSGQSGISTSHPSDSSIKSLLSDSEMSNTSKSIGMVSHTHSSDISLMQDNSGKKTGRSALKHSKSLQTFTAHQLQHPSDSSLQSLMYPKKEKMGSTEMNHGEEIDNTGLKTMDENVKNNVQTDQETGDHSDVSETAREEEKTSIELKESAGTKDAEIIPLAPKPKIRVTDIMHPSQESEESAPTKSTIRVTSGKHSSVESSIPDPVKPHIKTIGNKHATQESTQEESNKPHIKMTAGMGATRETEEIEQRKTLKTVDGKHVSGQTTAEEDLLVPHLKNTTGKHASTETEQIVAKVKPRSMFGHVSDISKGDYTLIAPKRKQVKGFSAFRESVIDEDMMNYQIKPHKRKRVEGMGIGRETEEKVVFRPHIKISTYRHASKESDFVDFDSMRLDKFKLQNIHGHASDSSVQKLLYCVTDEQEEDMGQVEKADIVLWFSTEVEPYNDNFDMLNHPPSVDLMGDDRACPYSGFGDYGLSSDPDIQAHHYMSLPALFKKSVTAPLIAQITLMNQSIVNYFTAELKMDQHFHALRAFLFMEDGEFGHSLSDQLFEKLSTSSLPHEIFNPVFLNNVLRSAISTSLFSEDKYAKNISFALKYVPTVLHSNAPDAMDCLELTYKVDWPVNIIITENCISKYSKIFTFMLQLKRGVWVLKDMWYQLKRDALLHNANNAYQFRQLQLFRHEMQHFVKVMQGYIANQIIHVTWNEFENDLNQNVKNLDDLHHRHAEYLNKCVFRCLLNKKACQVMKIIQDIFTLILKFRTQLVSNSWRKDRSTGTLVHPGFENMCATYKAFNDYSRFLFNVVNKLAMRGYQPHLQELLLRLNFNSYYKAAR